MFIPLVTPAFPATDTTQELSRLGSMRCALGSH